jgi:alkanesulfonate monooxygenase SsuD/methylene tetrahydromethanopterin reductase-like flavin-dependent oxidoreductase (luciferase family)
VGLSYFGIGEHHRPDYAVSAVVPVLAAAAAQTKNIRLGSAVTVLSTEDPVRVYQQFATLDLIAGGRAELTAGRGSFIESYALFGAALEDYDALYEEKLDLLLQLDARGAGHLERTVPASAAGRAGAAAASLGPSRHLDRHRWDDVLVRPGRTAGTPGDLRHAGRDGGELSPSRPGCTGPRRPGQATTRDPCRSG